MLCPTECSLSHLIGHFLLEVVVMGIKRELPDKEKMRKRAKYMKNMKELVAVEPINKAVPNGLEKGNGKTGISGKIFDRIFVWNLPPVITCPGMSNWCKYNCYNADDRYEKFPIDKWCENLWWVLNDKKTLEKRINFQLEEHKAERTAVRIHSSGDFFSNEYIAFWRDIISRNSDIYFWAYTRSWTVKELVDDIKELDKLDNIKLILSWDETMTQTIDGFAKSIVYNSDEEISVALNRKDGIACPEQYDLVSSCADCGICINKSLGNIYFVLH